jgi:hypothetical protein
MKDKRLSFVFVSFFVLGILSILFVGGCSQYDYTSPSPGVIDIRLHTKSTNLAFNPDNNFILKVDKVEAVRDDGKRAEIYEDIKAIGRTTNLYNTLDARAQDSSLVMGEGYLPPGIFIGVNLLITPATQVILDGYRNIPVVTDPKFNKFLAFRVNPGFEIKELLTTKIVITIDLDQSLIKKANSYLFNPVYEISSIR